MTLEIIEKKFDNQIVIENLFFKVEEGEKLAIVGPSGSGKTTLLRIISGLDNSFIGNINSSYKKPAFLFQEDRLVESLNVVANLKAVSNDKEKISYLLKRLNLEMDKNKKVSFLSGGMKRRVAIARVLLIENYDILILDEPFKGLDEALKEEVATLILEENKDRTLILVTHSENEAELLNVNREFKLLEEK